MNQENILIEMNKNKKRLSHKKLRSELLTRLGEDDLYVVFKKMFLKNDVANACLLLQIMPLNSIFNNGSFRKDIKYEYQKERKNIKNGAKTNFIVLSDNFFSFIGKCKTNLTYEEINNILIQNKIVNKRNNKKEPLFVTLKGDFAQHLKIWSTLQNIGWVLPEELIENALFNRKKLVEASDVFVKIMDKHIEQNFNTDKTLTSSITHKKRPGFIYYLLKELSENALGSFKDKYNNVLNKAITNTYFLESIQNDNPFKFSDFVLFVDKIKKLGVSKEEVDYYLNPFNSAYYAKEIKELLSMGYDIQPKNPDMKVWCQDWFHIYVKEKDTAIKDMVIVSMDAGLDILAPFSEKGTVIEHIKSNLGKMFNLEMENMVIALQEKRLLNEAVQESFKIGNKKTKRI